jgi:hypothetical protein
LSLSSWSHGLYCVSRFDCVWFLGKVSAHVLVSFKVEMPQVVHIMHEAFMASIYFGMSKR